MDTPEPDNPPVLREPQATYAEPPRQGSAPEQRAYLIPSRQLVAYHADTAKVRKRRRPYTLSCPDCPPDPTWTLRVHGREKLADGGIRRFLICPRCRQRWVSEVTLRRPWQGRAKRAPKAVQQPPPPPTDLGTDPERL